MAAQKGNAVACAALSYILIGIIWYFVDEQMKNDAFAKFHAKQGLILLIAAVIWHVAWSVLAVILTVVTFGLFALIGWLGYLVPWVFVILGLINAANGQKKALPIIGSYARIFTF